MALPASPVDRHAVVAGDFARLVEGTPDWSAPSPVAGWAARDVVAHLLTWFPGFLSGGGVALSAGPVDIGDPVAAWRHHADAVQALLAERGKESFTHPFAGSHRLEDAIDRFYTSDVFMHSWDLARAGGQRVDLDADLAARLLGGMQQMEDVLRSSGHYGAAVAVPDDAPVVDRLMGFIGRDPAWAPPA